MSIGFYVGKNLTADGSTLLGGFGHEVSSHWVDIVPAQTHPKGSMISVGATEEAAIPGELINIPQVTHTNKYISSTYSSFAGFPPPLTNGGLNEYGVAGRDIWYDARQELVDMTPEPQKGINYSDLARIAMERAKTAREAVEIIGGLIDQYGYSTYGGNTHLFADQDEGWVIIEFPGGQGLWAAEQLGPDEVRVSYPGYIQYFPVNFKHRSDYMGSDNIIEFAREQGWWNPQRDGPNYMNIQDVYGEPFPGVGVNAAEDNFTAMRVPPEREQELMSLVPVSLEDMLALVRDPRWSSDNAGYGQVAHIRPNVHPALQTLWLAVTQAVTTPYVPIPIATEPMAVPIEFVQHRYLTWDSDVTYLSPDYAGQEATRYATREFKRLLYFISDYPVEFLPFITCHIERLEYNMLAERDSLENQFLSLLDRNDYQKAIQLINENVTHWFTASLKLGMQLTDYVEAVTKQQYGLKYPHDTSSRASTITPWSQSMIQKENEPTVNAYDPQLDIYPRKFGIYS